MGRGSVLFFVLFLIACERSECYGIGRKGVSIKVVNKSGERIQKMILIAPDRQKHRDLNQPIENNAQTCITYKAGGESTYRLLVVLESGDTLQSSEHYAEGGYSFTETVEKHQVITSHSKY